MEVELVRSGEPAVVEAARRAVAAAGLGAAPWRVRGAWWRAGVAESIAGRSVEPAAGHRYDVAPSPRRTRGATRA